MKTDQSKSPLNPWTVLGIKPGARKAQIVAAFQSAWRKAPGNWEQLREAQDLALLEARKI